MLYFAAKNFRSGGGTTWANACPVEILSLVRNSTGFHALHYHVPIVRQIRPPSVDHNAERTLLRLGSENIAKQLK